MEVCHRKRGGKSWMKDCWDLERLKESEVSSVKEKVRGGRNIVPLIVQSAGPNVLRQETQSF